MKRNEFHAVLWFILLCMLIGGCGASDPSTSDQRVHRLIRNVLDPPLPSNKNRIVERLGPPEAMERRSVANPHLEDVQDTIYLLCYEGLRIQIYHAAYNNRQVLQRVKLSRSHWKPAGEIDLGMTKTRIKAKLDGPPSRSGDVWTYAIGEAESRVHLKFSVRRLQTITWDLYVD